MAPNRRRAKGRREGGTFTRLPHAVTQSPQYADLSAYAVKLLVDMLNQYRGHNNGDLSVAFRLMQRYGWKSKDTLNRARKELLNRGFIVLTRQGGRNQASLYAVTWIGIDECGGKLFR